MSIRFSNRGVKGKVVGGRNQIGVGCKRVGGEGMKEIYVNSTMGQNSPAHMPEKLKITITVVGTSLKCFLPAIS